MDEEKIKMLRMAKKSEIAKLEKKLIEIRSIRQKQESMRIRLIPSLVDFLLSPNSMSLHSIFSDVSFDILSSHRYSPLFFSPYSILIVHSTQLIILTYMHMSKLKFDKENESELSHFHLVFHPDY